MFPVRGQQPANRTHNPSWLRGSMLPRNHDGLIILFKFLNILIVFNISNINKEINKKLPEDDLIEDRNMLECFLNYFKSF